MAAKRCSGAVAPSRRQPRWAVPVPPPPAVGPSSWGSVRTAPPSTDRPRCDRRGVSLRRAAPELALAAEMRSSFLVAQHLSFPRFIEALDGAPFPGRDQESFHVHTDEFFFANPELLVKEGFDDLAAKVVLVSARGAAGKSRSAEELSRRLRAPLWRLERDRAVGATSLAFVLGRYMDVVSPETALQEAGGGIVLVDSLDEARARVSGTSWGEFLASIADATNWGCRFVLFGRERTLEDAWMSLDDADVTPGWVEISHFGPQQRLVYVDGVVEKRSRSASLLGHQFYTAARDAVLSSVTGTVPAPAAESFAGYAPVLDAVAAVLLREENLFAVSRAFSASGGDTRHLAELRRILDDLLVRDQEKMKPLATELGLDAKATYTPDEQIDWLVRDLEGGPDPDLRYITDGSTRSRYIERIAAFVEDHPFRNEDSWASTVFAAYVASRRFHGTLTGMKLLEIGNHSGLLYDLVALEGEQVVLLDEWQFSALHASVIAGEFSGALASIEAAQVDGNEHGGTIAVVRAGVPAEMRFTLLPEADDSLRLYGPLEGLTLSTSSAVRIASQAASVVLGPDLFIRCSALTIQAPSVDFAHRAAPVRDTEDSISMVTLEVTGELVLPGVIGRNPLPGDFELRVPAGSNLHYPWVAYREPLEDQEAADPNDRSVRFLNMLMNLTRAHGHKGDRGAFIMKLQGRQSVKGQEFVAAAEVLRQRGIARVEHEMIYIEPEAEVFRFSGKALPGQKQIADVWDFWGPVAQEIAERLRPR